MPWTTDDFNYQLDEELIAQSPLVKRSASRMMSVSKQAGAIQHDLFSNFTNYLQPNDLLIFNDTKVFPARLFGKKETGGKVECLIERICSEKIVFSHVRSSKSPKEGALLLFADGSQAKVLGRKGELFELEFLIDQPVLSYLQQHGKLPLPPYINRTPNKQDYERYQTVFASTTGAVAAPTASLHFDNPILEQIKQQGINVEYITLHVGAGTFQPVRTTDLQQHKMHSEWIQVNASVCAAIHETRAKGGRVIAVGTTVLRALESASLSGETCPFSGETDIFIYPGFSFKCVDALLTNFHLPKSTLLMLVSALAGVDVIKQAYAQAIAEKYRFFSYGDCMLIC